MPLEYRLRGRVLLVEATAASLSRPDDVVKPSQVHDVEGPAVDRESTTYIQQRGVCGCAVHCHAAHNTVLSQVPSGAPAAVEHRLAGRWVKSSVRSQLRWVFI